MISYNHINMCKKYLKKELYIYIYIYIEIYICSKTDNNDRSERRALLRGRHNSISVLLNHHQDHEG